MRPDAAVILSVDDDLDALAFVKMYLEKAGHRVICADSGARCIETLATETPDLVLMDVSMPEMDGYETCARIQRTMRPFLVPVIFLTAHDSPQDRARALALGAVDYLIKPIRPGDLLDAVRKHLVTKRRWADLRPTSHGERGLNAGDIQKFKSVLADELSVTPHERAALLTVASKELYAVAAEHGMPEAKLSNLIATFVGLDHVGSIDATAVPLGLLPPSFCQTNLVCPMTTDAGAVRFVVANPFDQDLLDLLTRVSDGAKGLTLAIAEPETIRGAFREHLAGATLLDLERSLQAEYQEEHVHIDGAAINETSKPIIGLVNKMIETAYDAGASDIHIEPWEGKVVIRYRIDGQLRTVHTLRPARLIGPIASRIKIMARLDIADRRLPQDGRISYTSSTHTGHPFDLRVSLVPSNYGEKVVMRILDLEKSVMPLSSMGFSTRHLALYKEKIASPYGMILHVGPTGSGKSMTLYAALNEMDKITQNIETIEDPIEYRLAGITQVQVNVDIGLTFPKALRSFLRQDPDVILVGEIRDSETARTAAEAALTGHLVLSTLHTNDAATTLTRLVELGVEPYLVSTSIMLVCAQRLLRRLCLKCRARYQPTALDRLTVGLVPGDDRPLYNAVGCPACNGTGYKGRIAAHELLAPDDAMRQLLTRPGCTALELKHAAVAAGMTTLYWDAMEKVRDGTTSVADVLGKVKADEFVTLPSGLV